MTSLEAALRRIEADLRETGESCALVGGLAVSVQTEPRFTRDADLAVAVGSDAEAEALIAPLRTLGYRLDAVVEQDAVDRLATVRLARSTETRPQDLIDLRALLRVASPDEITRARSAPTLIASRGYHRRRDLISEFDTLLSAPVPSR
jgi:hypothetical protein